MWNQILALCHPRPPPPPLSDPPTHSTISSLWPKEHRILGHNRWQKKSLVPFPPLCSCKKWRKCSCKNVKFQQSIDQRLTEHGDHRDIYGRSVTFGGRFVSFCYFINYRHMLCLCVYYNKQDWTLALETETICAEKINKMKTMMMKSHHHHHHHGLHFSS